MTEPRSNNSVVEPAPGEPEPPVAAPEPPVAAHEPEPPAADPEPEPPSVEPGGVPLRVSTRTKRPTQYYGFGPR